MQKEECVFCKIAKKKEKAWIIFEDEHVICFLPKKVEAYGHTLIVPKRHYADLYDIPEDMLDRLIRTSKRLALAYREKIHATGANLMHASGIDGEQSVFHFHTHLLPRFKNDCLKTWPKLPPREVNKDELARKLKAD